MKPKVLFLLLLAAAVCRADAPRTGTVLILHTNDFHGHVSAGAPDRAGAARIAAYFAAERARRPDVLALDAGDCVAGTPVSTMFQGRPIFEVMSAMKYDLGCLGNHEFDHGWGRIREYRELAAHPLLCANAKSPKGELLGDAEYEVRTVGGVRVGVIGVITEHTPFHVQVEGTKGCAFEPEADAVRRLLPEVRAKSDVVVVLSHCGVDADEALARAVDGIDLIVGGHSHTRLEAPRVVGRTRIVQAGCYGTCVGRVEVRVDLEARKVTDLQASLVPAARLPKEGSPEVARIVASWEAKVAEKVDIPIGTCRADMDQPRLKAFVEAVFLEEFGADVGYYNIGGIRDRIPKGPVTVRNVWNVLPFRNTVVVFSMRGRDLAEAFGIQGKDPERRYKVATNSYVFGHTQKAYPEKVLDPVDTGIVDTDLLVEVIRKRKEIE